MAQCLAKSTIEHRAEAVWNVRFRASWSKQSDGFSATLPMCEKCKDKVERDGRMFYAELISTTVDQLNSWKVKPEGNPPRRDRSCNAPMLRKPKPERKNAEGGYKQEEQWKTVERNQIVGREQLPCYRMV